MVKGLNKFIASIPNKDPKLQGICIKKIVRVKNGFLNFQNKNWNEYSDVKINVLIESASNDNISNDDSGKKQYAIIGEIQFLLDCMYFVFNSFFVCIVFILLFI